MLYAVVNRGRQLIDFDSPDFIKDLENGFSKGIQDIPGYFMEKLNM